MKRTRKLVALVAVITLLATLWVPAAVSAEAVPAAQQESIAYFGRSILAQMDNSEALLYAYDRLVSGCEALSTRVDISHRTHQLNAEEASLVWEVVTSDHPAFFWLADGVSIRSSGGVVTSYGLNVPTDAAKKRAAIDARVAELTADLADKSDYEKSLILHDRLAEINTYQYTANDQTVIGSLLEGQSVCAGYARAYQLLMQAVGIPVFYVTGHSKGQGHAWNLVQLDGEWYYTDVTWDDQNDDGGAIYYAYFNVTYEQICEDHTAEEFAEYLPRTTATAANYHVRHDTMMDLPTGEIIATLYEADLPIRLYMTGDINAFLSEMNNALYDAADRVACIGSGFSCNMTYLGREIIINLSISRPHNYDSKNTCTKCGYKKVENHHYFITVIDPTCGNKGRIIYTCSYCEKSYFEYIPATGEHTYETVVTEPNCVHGGYTTYTCTVCGDSYDTDFIPSIEHNYEVVTTDPTCAESGLNVYTCIDCSYSFSEPIPPTGEHSYETVVTEPDCVNGGYTTYTCTVCGDSYDTDFIPSIEHNYVAVTTDPTCVESGLNVYTCIDCSYSFSEPIPATGEHSYETVVTEPDCVNGGYTTYTCTVCGDSYDSDPTAPTEHNYEAVTTDPTCAESGQTVYTCTKCGDSYDEPIPATGEHTYETVVTEPDCVNGGYTTYICTVCGDSYDSDPTAPTEHNYEAVTTDPTCAESGQIVYTCIDCSYSYSEPIPPTGEHVYEAVVTAPDCVHEGYTTHTCTVCGDNYVTDPVPATGKHVYDSNLDPDCNVCGEKRNVTVPGDADGNGKVNNRDLGLLLLYLNDGDLSGKVFDVIAMDMDGNGKLNNRDLGLLQKLLNV